jgi:hypothetical protein
MLIADGDNKKRTQTHGESREESCRRERKRSGRRGGTALNSSPIVQNSSDVYFFKAS